MTHTYNISGMTCANCEAKVKSELFTLPDVTSAEVSKEKGTATITMSKHIALSDLQKAIGGENGKYKITAAHHNEVAEQTKSWFAIYKPILLIFAYITGIASIASFHNGTIHAMHFMQFFMAGFFLTFSFFKMLNLSDFAESYAMYDVIAKRIPALGLCICLYGIGFGCCLCNQFQSVHHQPHYLNCNVVSIIGVLQSVLNKKKIQCACLGAVFNLPMSTVTIIEDALMIAMSVAMLILL